MIRHIVINYSCWSKDKGIWNRVGYLVITTEEHIASYEDLIRIVTEYLATINKRFTESIIIDGTTFIFDFDLGILNYDLVDGVYKSFNVRYATRHSNLKILPPEQMLDALPDISPYAEFHL